MMSIQALLQACRGVLVPGVLAGVLALSLGSSLVSGCWPGGETGGFYTRLWFPEHLLLVDRNEKRTHVVAFETDPPGFHYSADARTRPPTELIVHTPDESVAAFDLTPEILERWRTAYFSNDESRTTEWPEKDSKGYHLRHRADGTVPRFLTCYFRASDNQLKSVEFRIDRAAVDSDTPLDPGPFWFSLGEGPRVQLPLPIADFDNWIEEAKTR